MIPKTQNREVISGGSTDDMSFGISMEHQAHIMSILRDRLYTDKILAVLREYGANAWDANREAGRGDQPIMVIVPTDIEPSLTIRDSGLGLSPEGMRKVFTQYGNSTKRDSNGAVGMLGIGSKSGFAYATNFTITSWHGNMKYIYSAVLDPSNKGKLLLLHSEPCGDETGVEIHISVKKQDVWLFQDRAKDLYRFFVPRPEINIDLPAPEEGEQLTNGTLTIDTTRWIAVMGCVPYRVDMGQLRDIQGFDCDNIDKFGGIMHFNIGDVDVSASREELEYNDATKRALVDKFNALVDEYVLKTIKSIESVTGTNWEKRLKAQDLNRLGLAPEGDMFAKWAILKDEILAEIKNCRVWRGSELARTINFNAQARIVVQDDFRRTISGFHLQEYDYLVKSANKSDLAAVKADVETLVKLLKIDGITVLDLSTLPWTPKHRNGLRSPNPKHHVRTFKLRTNGGYFHKPYSSHWEAETEREATEQDIHVVIMGFVADYDFFRLYGQDKRLAATFGVTMPDVYGYKRTEKKPAAPVGKEYREWSIEFRKTLMTTANLALLTLRERARAVTHDFYRAYSYDSVNEKSLAVIQAALGPDHEIFQFLSSAHEARKQLADMNADHDVLDLLANIAGTLSLQDVKNAKAEMQATLDNFYVKYPLLRTGSLLYIVNAQAKDWLDYIKIVDKVS